LETEPRRLLLPSSVAIFRVALPETNNAGELIWAAGDAQQTSEALGLTVPPGAVLACRRGDRGSKDRGVSWQEMPPPAMSAVPPLLEQNARVATPQPRAECPVRIIIRKARIEHISSGLPPILLQNYFEHAGAKDRFKIALQITT